MMAIEIKLKAPAPAHSSLMNKNVIIGGFILLALSATGQEMTVAPDHTNGIYQVGQAVNWQVTWSGGSNPPAAQYQLLSGGLAEAGHGKLSFSNQVADLQTSFSAPGTMLVKVSWTWEGSEHRTVAGAVAAPQEIGLSAPRPGDFDKFWAAKIKELEQVPMDPKLERVAVGNSNVLYWKITMNNIRDTQIQGQLARPVVGKKFPALLIVQWAGVYGLEKNWVTDRASEGWLALNIEPHDLPIDLPKTFYKEKFDGPLKEYWSIGNDDRDTSYFLRMYLSGYRALEYLTHRDDWDGKTLVVMGDSQGGMQTLMLAGLPPQALTAAIALVPAGCDMLGPEMGRAGGWPNWYFNTNSSKDPAKIHEASRYFDVANFAPEIRCPVLVGLGLCDQVCPPAGVLAAINQIKSPKQTVVLPKSGHQDEHGTQAAFNKLRYSVWLPALVHGQPPPFEN
jgi:cephalosporin-C deacetylase